MRRLLFFCRLALCFFALILLSLAQTPLAVDAEAPQADTDIAISELFYRGGTGEDWVEIVNLGSETIDIGKWWFCSKFVYQQLDKMTLISGDDFVMLPGEVIVVRAWRDLNDSIADLGLYSTNSFSSPGAMVDYVQWGTEANPGRGSVAVSKGIWRESMPGVYDFVPTAGVTESAQWSGINSGGGLLTFGTDWTNGVPSQGTFAKPTFSLFLPQLQKGE